jgi:hypothetical protein
MSPTSLSIEIRDLKNIINIYINIIGQTKEENFWIFDEVDVLQRLKAGPIPE